jgi:ornithine cyclodeaminase/alanine dehydrogenase-like protein (mu-crystallin family)
MPLLLNEADVRAVLPMGDLIDAMQGALVQFSAGHVQQPLRTVIEVGAQKAFFGVMPAFIPDPPALGTKLVSVFGTNKAEGLPTHLATIVLLDPRTGELLALLDGRYITEARTAAVSAVSTRLLAREDAATLAIIGSGVQARSHLEALSHVRTLRDVRVWSPNAQHCADFVRDMGGQARQHAGTRSVPIRAAESARAALDGADLVVLATAARDTVVKSAWIADGAHICAVGACRPDQRETDSDLMLRARLYVDSRTGALAEAGDIVLPMKEGVFDATHIVGELGELAAGRVAGRTSAADVTLFKSLGMAVEDVAAAHLAYTRAAGRGLGRGIVL